MSTNPNGRDTPAYSRRTFLQAIPVAGLATIGSGTAAAQPVFPDTLPLPTGFQPEGIATGRGTTFFVGSLALGAVYRGDVRTGAGAMLVPATTDRVAIGLSHDARNNRLFVAGGPTGKGFVYDAQTGASLAAYSLTVPGSFVNDVVVTASAAYFTDSFRPFLYRVPLGPGGQLPEQDDVAELPLGDAFQSVPGFNTNGIDAVPSGDVLLIVNSTTGNLYTVDPKSGEASEIDLGGAAVTNGDGILLDGQTLYVVRNRNNEIAVVRLEPDAAAGELVGAITDPAFDVPTTVAAFGSHLYAVNARFGTDNPDTASYSVVRVPK